MDKCLEKIWQEKEILRRSDGSYVIDTGMPYHVPNSSEWQSLWSEIEAYANEYPERIKEERTQIDSAQSKTEKTAQKVSILSRLSEIDIESVRPLRAIVQDAASDYDKEKLSTLDKEAKELRDKLAKLDT